MTVTMDRGVLLKILGEIPKPVTLLSESGMRFTFEERDKDDPHAQRCAYTETEIFCRCLLIHDHDGPHIPITKEADNTAPEGKHYVITSMGRRKQRRVTPACRDEDHDRCKCLNPGQNPQYAGKLVDFIDGEFVIVGDCECECHG